MSLERGRYFAILGALILRERKKRQWAQADLASRLDISQSTVARIEKGSLSVDTYLFGQIAEHLFERSRATLDGRIHKMHELYQRAQDAVGPSRIPSRDAERKLIDYVVETNG